MSSPRLLIDTNVISELRKPRPAPAVLELFKQTRLEDLYLSVVTLAEIRYGIANASEPDKRLALSQWLDNRVRPLFGPQRVLAIDEDIMLVWRQLLNVGRKSGHTFAQPDLLLAATAQHHGLTLVTRNTKDFERTSASLLDPWKTS